MKNFRQHVAEIESCYFNLFFNLRCISLHQQQLNLNYTLSYFLLLKFNSIFQLVIVYQKVNKERNFKKRDEI
ncbi:hypothetical protein CWO85_00500 [Candidatus Phytoplasma ziziphi]|uniref:Uncharacterized protein n=1 Tax=Ziziphus jujuba witches'-broom phytoplasma TaxID=135727 RepID=A0A660HM00_ZIZJU|nr:hypothetical protein [Candidatus Phytoplasma ziziphi]AYJ01022.1 hypothetical protein CWO85_00500 [Candidatus Phytoplasma ziziphi]